MSERISEQPVVDRNSAENKGKLLFLDKAGYVARADRSKLLSPEERDARAHKRKGEKAKIIAYGKKLRGTVWHLKKNEKAFALKGNYTQATKAAEQTLAAQKEWEKFRGLSKKDKMKLV